MLYPITLDTLHMVRGGFRKLIVMLDTLHTVRDGFHKLIVTLDTLHTVRDGFHKFIVTSRDCISYHRYRPLLLS